MLGIQIPAAQGEPFKWRIEIESALAQRDDVNGNALIIDLKAKNTTNVSLYEIAQAWGYSAAIMLHLRGLFVDHDRSGIDDKQFTRQTDEIVDPVFSMTYLSGTVRDGTLVGTSTTPGRGVTNSVLMWPDTLAYFCAEAQKVIKGSE